MALGCGENAILLALEYVMLTRCLSIAGSSGCICVRRGEVPHGPADRHLHFSRSFSPSPTSTTPPCIAKGDPYGPIERPTLSFIGVTDWPVPHKPTSSDAVDTSNGPRPM